MPSSVSGASLGYTPTMQGIRPRVQGETEDEYRRYVQRVQGEQARALATQRGIDTSGMAWNGNEFQDTDRGFGRAILSRPEIMIPLVLGSGFAVGSLGAPAASQAAANATAGGVLPSSSYPAASLMGGPAAASAGLSGAGGAALGGAMPAAASAGGRGIANSLRDALTDPSTYANALPAIIAALSGVGGGGGGNNSEELRRINAITEAQMRRADPLHQTAVNLAFGRMPINARQGVTLNNVPLPPG